MADSESSEAKTLPAETSEAEALPTETPEAKTLPAESSEAKTLPTETPEAETLPTESAEAETLPTESAEAKPLPTETSEAETLPSETPEAKTLPTESSEVKTLPVESSETKTLPSETSEAKPVLVEQVQSEPLQRIISHPPANSEIFGDDSSKIKKFAYKLDGIDTDFLVCDYKERQFIVISQYQKIGTLYLVSKNKTAYPDGINNYFDVWTLCGADISEYHLVARFLGEQLEIKKPVLFGISLKDSSLRTLKGIVRAFKEQAIF